jgi:hypothetical protein
VLAVLVQQKLKDPASYFCRGGIQQSQHGTLLLFLAYIKMSSTTLQKLKVKSVNASLTKNRRFLEF